MSCQVRGNRFYEQNADTIREGKQAWEISSAIWLESGNSLKQCGQQESKVLTSPSNVFFSASSSTSFDESAYVQAGSDAKIWFSKHAGCHESAMKGSKASKQASKQTLQAAALYTYRTCVLHVTVYQSVGYIAGRKIDR